MFQVEDPIMNKRKWSVIVSALHVTPRGALHNDFNMRFLFFIGPRQHATPHLSMTLVPRHA